MTLDEQFYKLGWRIIEFNNHQIAYFKLISPTAYQIINIPRFPSQPLLIRTCDNETDRHLSLQIFSSTKSFLDNMEKANLPRRTV